MGSNLFAKKGKKEQLNQVGNEKKKTKKAAQKRVINEALKDDKIVSMAEKVKFWQEQDSINNAVIPRVLKNHELIVELNSQLSKKNDEVVKLKIENDKLKSRINKLEIIRLDPQKKITVVYLVSIIALIVAIIAIII